MGTLTSFPIQTKSLNEAPEITELVNHTQDSTIHVTAANKAAWNAKYDKPASGVPKADLASSVRESLEKADSAYQKPSSGVPKTDLASAVQTSLGKADSAYQKPTSGVPKTDLASAVQTSLGKADSAYQKPSSGVPKSDLASGIQASINKADAALPSADMLSVYGLSVVNGKLCVTYG